MMGLLSGYQQVCTTGYRFIRDSMTVRKGTAPSKFVLIKCQVFHSPTSQISSVPHFRLNLFLSSSRIPWCDSITLQRLQSLQGKLQDIFLSLKKSQCMGNANLALHTLIHTSYQWNHSNDWTGFLDGRRLKLIQAQWTMSHPVISHTYSLWAGGHDW